MLNINRKRSSIEARLRTVCKRGKDRSCFAHFPSNIDRRCGSCFSAKHFKNINMHAISPYMLAHHEAASVYQFMAGGCVGAAGVTRRIERNEEERVA